MRNLSNYNAYSVMNKAMNGICVSSKVKPVNEKGLEIKQTHNHCTELLSAKIKGNHGCKYAFSDILFECKVEYCYGTKTNHWRKCQCMNVVKSSKRPAI